MANSPHFGLAILFQNILFCFLDYRCFITLFSTGIFDFETFCSCKFISCVLKSKYILLMLIYLKKANLKM